MSGDPLDRGGAVAAVEMALGCFPTLWRKEPSDTPIPGFSSCGVFGHGTEYWTERGCAVAVKAADAVLDS